MDEFPDDFNLNVSSELIPRKQLEKEKQKEEKQLDLQRRIRESVYQHYQTALSRGDNSFLATIDSLGYELLDKKYQRQLLEKLLERFPNSVYMEDYAEPLDRAALASYYKISLLKQ